jgi:dTMP kinase
VNLRGKFITFEGSEGSGKSTQIERLVRRLQHAGLETLVTREPGGTALGEEIRNLLLHHRAGGTMEAETELLLFAAARAQLVRERIAPALAAGQVVICDRFLDSTTVYQGAARRLATEAVVRINHFAVGHHLPDLTFLLDVPVEVSHARVRGRGDGRPDRIERESADFFGRVRAGYLALAQAESRRIAVIDSTRPIDEVESLIWQTIHERLA